MVVVNRANLYLAMALALLNTEEAIVFSKELGMTLEGCDRDTLKASILRVDKDPLTRELLPKTIAMFYERAGYEALQDPDDLSTMFAFMAQLARQENTEALKVQHRFLRTHLIPTLKYAVERCSGLRKLYEIVTEDAEYLKQLLTRRTTS